MKSRHYFFPQLTGPDALTLAEAPVDKPGVGNVLVRLHAASLNYRDLVIAEGRSPAPVVDRLIPLSDAAGEIVEIGERVTHWKSGDRVMGSFMQAWINGELPLNGSASVLGGPVQGVLAEYRVFPEGGLVRVPEHLDWEEAATLPCAALTAWSALFEYQRLKETDTVLVLGTGGVATFALQFAATIGARAIVASSSDEKIEKARSLGATAGINYKNHPDWHLEVRRLTQGRGVDHVIEVGGGGTLERSLKSARPGGLVHMIGVLQRGEMDPREIVTSGAIVRGIRNGSRAMFERMAGMIEHHRIHPVVDRVFPFEEAKDAYRALQRADHVGKIAIRIRPKGVAIAPHPPLPQA
jgi:NADPH:quinone reductase-like Zn-dependent oxidoreductase